MDDEVAMSVDTDFESVFLFLDGWRMGEYGLIITDACLKEGENYVELFFEGECRISCEDLFIDTVVFEDLYERMYSAYINYGSGSALFDETVRVVEGMCFDRFNNGLNVVNDIVDDVIESFDRDLMSVVNGVELVDDVVVLVSVGNISPVLVDCNSDILKGLFE